jgi:hypothetical protein
MSQILSSPALNLEHVNTHKATPSISTSGKNNLSSGIDDLGAVLAKTTFDGGPTLRQLPLSPSALQRQSPIKFSPSYGQDGQPLRQLKRLSKSLSDTSSDIGQSREADKSPSEDPFTEPGPISRVNRFLSQPIDLRRPLRLRSDSQSDVQQYFPADSSPIRLENNDTSSNPAKGDTGLSSRKEKQKDIQPLLRQHPTDLLDESGSRPAIPSSNRSSSSKKSQPLIDKIENTMAKPYVEGKIDEDPALSGSYPLSPDSESTPNHKRKFQSSAEDVSRSGPIPENDEWLFDSEGEMRMDKRSKASSSAGGTKYMNSVHSRDLSNSNEDMNSGEEKVQSIPMEDMKMLEEQTSARHCQDKDSEKRDQPRQTENIEEASFQGRNLRPQHLGTNLHLLDENGNIVFQHSQSPKASNAGSESKQGNSDSPLANASGKPSSDKLSTETEKPPDVYLNIESTKTSINITIKIPINYA